MQRTSPACPGNGYRERASLFGGVLTAMRVTDCHLPR
jgi:hypothetical protein